MMRSEYLFYIAASTRRIEEARSMAARLRRLGYGVTSTWHDEGTVVNQYPVTDENREDFEYEASRDWQEVAFAGHLVLLTQREGCSRRCGRMVETGLAMGVGNTIHVVGVEENLFLVPDTGPQNKPIHHYEDTETFFQEVTSIVKSPGTYAQ